MLGLKKQGHGRDTALLMVYRNRRGLSQGEDGLDSLSEDGVKLVNQVLNLRANFLYTIPSYIALNTGILSFYAIQQDRLNTCLNCSPDCSRERAMFCIAEAV